MAGKKIASKKKIDAGGPISKTARASKAKKKEEGFIASGDMDRIIPLCGGEWAYLLDPRDGRTHHLQVNSDKWNTMVSDLILDSHYGARILNQLQKMGWNIPQ